MGEDMNNTTDGNSYEITYKPFDGTDDRWQYDLKVDPPFRGCEQIIVSKHKSSCLVWSTEEADERIYASGRKPHDIIYEWAGESPDTIEEAMEDIGYE